MSQTLEFSQARLFQTCCTHRIQLIRQELNRFRRNLAWPLVHGQTTLEWQECPSPIWDKIVAGRLKLVAIGADAVADPVYS
jgi:hypothetical protein